MNLIIGYLYGDLMNIYGDLGNIIALKKRCEWRGINLEVKQISVGSSLKKGDVDLYFFGGGQDQQQSTVAKDLARIGKIIRSEVDCGVPLLAICGGYQLLGAYYKPLQGPKLPGISLFRAYTQAGHTRMIGNIVIDSRFGRLVGFENHSGQTFLEKSAQALGKVKSGFGNNGQDQQEGCIYKNAIGCYMHGSLLPKNPKLADFLIKTALEVKYGKSADLVPLDDELENKAHYFAVSKFG